MKKVAFYTLGCRVNQYETEVMRERFEKKGYQITDFDDCPDIFVINTCSVTAIAERKARRVISKAAKVNQDALIVIAGCYSQTSPEEVKKIKNVDIVIGNGEKNRIVEITEQAENNKYSEVGDIMKTDRYTPLFASANSGKTRALIKIEEGCNNFCSYCIIPYARGPVRSRDETDILKEATALADAGYKEIVLTGIHITSYGTDRGRAELADLLIELHKIPGIERIRLGSLELTPEMNKIADMANKLPKLCPHFHMSLQSGSDTVLKRMNRRYTAEEYLVAAKKLKKAFDGAAITTDIIVGFPGETEKEFEESWKFAEKVGFAKIHVFPYSPRKGTAAANMSDQVSDEIKKIRTKKMQKTASKLEKDFYKYNIGRELNVLFERKVSENIYEGHAENYILVQRKSANDLSGKILKVKTSEVNGKALISNE